MKKKATVHDLKGVETQKGMAIQKAVAIELEGRASNGKFDFVKRALAHCPQNAANSQGAFQDHGVFNHGLYCLNLLSRQALTVI